MVSFKPLGVASANLHVLASSWVHTGLSKFGETKQPSNKHWRIAKCPWSAAMCSGFVRSMALGVSSRTISKFLLRAATQSGVLRFFSSNGKTNRQNLRHKQGSSQMLASLWPSPVPIA